MQEKSLIHTVHGFLFFCSLLLNRLCHSEGENERQTD